VRWPRTTLAPACKHLETLRALTHRIITRDYHMCSLLHADQGNRHRRYRSNAQGGGGTALTIFGAICPEHGKGAGLVLPLCNTEAMTLHLAEIARTIAFGAHAVVLMDQAGWHMTGKLDVPGNISIIALPAKCPELNPVENIWQFMRDNWLSNRVFTSHDDIVDHCCEAWNKRVDQPWRIMTIGHRKWAHGL
jgi:transposase